MGLTPAPALSPALCATLVLLLAGCGTAAAPAVDAPPPRIQLSARVGDGSVSVSPSRVGAGPASLLISNQAARTVVVAVTCNGRRAGTSAPVAASGATELSVELSPGLCRVGALRHRRETDAQAFLPSRAPAAAIRVGPARAPGNGTLLAP